MIALVAGMTLREQFMIVGIQLIYAVIYSLLIFDGSRHLIDELRRTNCEFGQIENKVLRPDKRMLSVECISPGSLAKSIGWLAYVGIKNAGESDSDARTQFKLKNGREDQALNRRDSNSVTRDAGRMFVVAYTSAQSPSCAAKDRTAFQSQRVPRSRSGPV
jgi:hypothetical protein